MRRLWSSRPLRDLAEFRTGSTPNKSVPEYWGGDIPWVTVKDMKAMRLSVITNTLTELGASKATVSPGGSVLILVRGMGLFRDLPITHCPEPVCFNQDIKSLIPTADIDSEFLAFALVARKKPILHHVEKAGHGTGRLSTDSLMSTLVPHPPVLEQARIAKALRTWETAIDMLSRLAKEARRLYTGMQHRVFAPCHPTYRHRPASWRAFRIGDLFRERKQSGTSTDPLLGISLAHGVVPHELLGRKDRSSPGRPGYKLILPGDIGYNTMRMWQGVSGLATQRGIISPAYTVLTANGAQVNPDYAARLFKSPRMVFDFRRYSQGLTSDTWNLRYASLARIRVFLPTPRLQLQHVASLKKLERKITLFHDYGTLLVKQARGVASQLMGMAEA